MGFKALLRAPVFEGFRVYSYGRNRGFQKYDWRDRMQGLGSRVSGIMRRRRCEDYWCPIWHTAKIESRENKDWIRLRQTTRAGRGEVGSCLWHFGKAVFDGRALLRDRLARARRCTGRSWWAREECDPELRGGCGAGGDDNWTRESNPGHPILLSKSLDPGVQPGASDSPFKNFGPGSPTRVIRFSFQKPPTPEARSGSRTLNPGHPDAR